jgi:TRAP-type C4-dicarboxylate transport system permease large subunit
MNIDTELETWRAEWREQTELLPDLKKKIRRQDRRSMIAIGLACVCLILSAVAVRRTHSAFFSGLASGLWFTCLTMGSYAWWVRRGTWKPASQTTAAYIALWHKRAVAKERIVRLAFRFLFTATILYAGFVTWTWKDFSLGSAAVLAAIVAELFWLKRMAQKKQREIQTTQKLSESSGENSEVTFGGRQV